MDDMSWRQRGLVLLSILAMTLIGLAINKAPAGEQTRFYGPDGRSTGTATTSGNTTTFYGADGRRIRNSNRQTLADFILLDNDLQRR